MIFLTQHINMNTFYKAVSAIAIITLLSSCQSSTDPKQVLANEGSRKMVMDSIANNGDLMKEMMASMSHSSTAKTIMMENHMSMMKMMKDSSMMMHRMMSDMMETAEGDTSMMSGMCKKMMESKPMMDMMNKMKATDSKKKK